MAVDVNRASAAERLATTILGTNKTQIVAQNPEERFVKINVNFPWLTIESKADHILLPLLKALRGSELLENFRYPFFVGESRMPELILSLRKICKEYEIAVGLLHPMTDRKYYLHQLICQKVTHPDIEK